MGVGPQIDSSMRKIALESSNEAQPYLEEAEDADWGKHTARGHGCRIVSGVMVAASGRMI